MRINEFEKNIIIEAIKETDPKAKVWLFGSRVDDSKKGGDIDIAILSTLISDDIMKEILIRRHICDRIGEQKIDIVISGNGEDTFFKYATEKGILLNG